MLFLNFEWVEGSMPYLTQRRGERCAASILKISPPIFKGKKSPFADIVWKHWCMSGRPHSLLPPSSNLPLSSYSSSASTSSLLPSSSLFGYLNKSLRTSRQNRPNRQNLKIWLSPHVRTAWGWIRSGTRQQCQFGHGVLVFVTMCTGGRLG